MTWVRWVHQIHKLAGYFCHEYWNGLKCRAWKNPMHTNCDSEFYQKMLSTIKQKEKMGLQVSKGKMHNNPKFSVGRSENRLPTLQGGIPGKVYRGVGSRDEKTETAVLTLCWPSKAQMFRNIAQKRGSKHPDHVTMTKHDGALHPSYGRWRTCCFDAFLGQGFPFLNKHTYWCWAL